MVGRALIRAPVSDDTVPERCGIMRSEGEVLVTARSWQGHGGMKSAKAPLPSFVPIWNWLGLISHGGYFLVLPFWDDIPMEMRTGAIAALALPLFIGHFFFWHARRIKGRGAG
jgi:hypothetical protein